MNSPSSFTRVFILHENIHATRVIILSAEGLSTMFKNYLREITWGNGPFPRALSPRFQNKTSYETMSFSCQSNTLSQERFCTAPRFETEAQSNKWPINSFTLHTVFFVIMAQHSFPINIST